jgi:Domain of unknown function (DUF5658)
MSRGIRRSLEIGLYATIALMLIGAPAFGGAKLDEPNVAAQEAPSPGAAAPSRPPALVPLYVSFATLQILDVHSTLRAPDFGGQEANPILGGIVGSPALFVAAKAGVTTAVILVTERLWKRNKAAAVLMMIGLNSAYAGVVARNYRVEARASAVR